MLWQTDVLRHETAALAKGTAQARIEELTATQRNVGRQHPADAGAASVLQQFVGDAKAVVAGMTSTGFTLADTNDRGMLYVVGFHTSAPMP